MQLPDTAQSTRPPDNAGLSTKVSPFNPELVWAVAVMTPELSEDADSVYFVAGEQPEPLPTHGTTTEPAFAPVKAANVWMELVGTEELYVAPLLVICTHVVWPVGIKQVLLALAGSGSTR